MAVRELSERVARLEGRPGWLGLPADLVDADMRHWPASDARVGPRRAAER
jgi:hypothetical protein